MWHWHAHAPPRSAPAVQYANLDCSEIDYSNCEDMKDKAAPIAATMKAKLLACGC